MHVAFTIPTWLLWVIGVPVAGAIVGLAIFGAVMFWQLRKWPSLM